MKRWPKDKITLRNRARVIEQSWRGLAQSSACQHVHARPSNQPEPDTERRYKPSRPVVMIIECCAANYQEHYRQQATEPVEDDPKSCE